MRAGIRNRQISFLAAATSTNDYNETVEDWDDPAVLATRMARVRFGTAQEKREAAQESANQTATFECVRSATLDAIPMTARIGFLGDTWDIVEKAPLDRQTIRFTAVRVV